MEAIRSSRFRVRGLGHGFGGHFGQDASEEQCRDRAQRVVIPGPGFRVSGSRFRFPSFGIQACNGQSVMVGVAFRGG